jgi:hypothetical protein
MSGWEVSAGLASASALGYLIVAVTILYLDPRTTWRTVQDYVGTSVFVAVS